MGRQFDNKLQTNKKKPKNMKTAFVAAAGLAVAQASMKSLGSNIDSYSAAHANSSSRAFSGATATGFAPINGYGCWCYLDDTWRDANQVLINRPAILAHGKVVDALDESCRELINSYKCIEMDAEANGIADCDAQAVSYTAFSFIPSADLATECADNNPGDECAANACIVEGAFTLRFLGDLADMTAHVDFDAAHVHTNNAFSAGTFDPVVSCPGIPNPVGSDKECCGDHALLTRHPSRLYSGFTTRSCCVGEVINNELSQCCVSTGVTDINESC